MMNVDSEKQERVMDAFRRWGYLQADLDPLGHFAPLPHPELDISGDVADAARRIYCGSIGVEFMHIPDPERRQWIQERMESEQARSRSIARAFSISWCAPISSSRPSTRATSAPSATRWKATRR